MSGSNAATSGSAGGSVKLVTAPVTTTVTVKDLLSNSPIQGARVYLKCGSGGPLTSGTVIFNDLTDQNGQVSDTRSLSSDQPVNGWVRKASTAPYYKTYYLAGTIDNESGLDLIAQMVRDE